MKSSLCPNYLSSLAPQIVQSRLRYNRRNSSDLDPINAPTTLYYNLFLSSSIRAWNGLSEAARCSRNLQILHIRLRTNCSPLNLHLFIKNISDSHLCSCGSFEDHQLYFFYYMHYQRQQKEFLNEIARYATPTLNLLLYGDSSLSFQTNTAIFKNVHRYIINTKHFTYVNDLYDDFSNSSQDLRMHDSLPAP